jgi:NADH-quinone oxidoreductase subunit A
MAATSLIPYAAIGITILIVMAIIVVMMILAHGVGPRRRGPVKDSPYESGMPTVGDTHRRFNIRFYLVAMLFLLFDVEIIFMWPWVKAFYLAAAEGATFEMENGDVAGKGFILAGMVLFFALLVFGLIYEWKRGALEWE